MPKIKPKIKGTAIILPESLSAEKAIPSKARMKEISKFAAQSGAAVYQLFEARNYETRSNTTTN